MFLMEILMILLYVILFTLSFFGGAFALKVTNKLFKIEENSYKRAMKIFLFPFLVSVVFVLVNSYLWVFPLLLYWIINFGILIFYILLVKREYFVGWGKAIFIPIISGILSGIWISLLIFVLVLLFALAGFAVFFPI